MPRKKKETAAEFKKVVVPLLNVRSDKSIRSQKVGQLTFGSVVEIDKNFKDEEWEHISGSDVEGYCMSKFLDSITLDKKAKSKSKEINTEHSTCDSNVMEGADNGREESKEN